MGTRIKLTGILFVAIMAQMTQPAMADRLDAALAKPQATGLLIAEVLNGGQAVKNGLTPGDIITAYGAVAITDLKSLRDARATMAGHPAIAVSIIRDGAAITVNVNAESLGIKAMPVRQGVPAELLPPGTGAVIDLSHASFPVDAWYTIEIDKKKAGYEHMLLTRDGDRITLKTELAFSCKDSDGDPHSQHYITTVGMKSLTDPKIVSSHHRFPPGFTNDGRLELTGTDGKPAWISKATWPDEEGGKPVTKSGQTTIPAPADLMPDFGIEQLAAYLPMTPDACCHLTLLNTGAGDLTDRAALKVVGAEDVEIGGKKIRATRIDCHTIGEIPRTIWIGPHQQVVQADWLLYSAFAVHAKLTDRQGAMDGVTTPELQPIP